MASPFLIHCAGFTVGGVAAGSLAAGIQSIFYGGTVLSTSLFALLQSVGATGIGIEVIVFIFLSVVGVMMFNKILVFPYYFLIFIAIIIVLIKLRM